MATMTKKSESEKRYSFDTYEDRLYLDDYSGCCGSSIAPGYHEEEIYGTTFEQAKDASWTGNYTKEQWKKEFPYTSLFNMAQGWYKQLLAGRDTSMVQIALVTKWKNNKKKTNQGQAPILFNYLKKTKRWKEYHKFINSNTGNEVTVLGKVFPSTKKKNTGIFTSGW